jgi:magnesium-protoporphyrin O-methyltransferase
VRCCGPAGVEIFDERQARKDAARYRRRGIDRTAWQLVDAVAGTGEDALEIGGGVGGIELELLRRGTKRAVNVELSPAYEPFARDLIAEAGVTDRVERRVGDVVGNPELAQPADVVVLHRVVCCYPDMPALVGTAAGKARRALALSYPRDSWWTRLAARIVNAWMRLRRKAFRTFIHPPEGIRAAAQAQGLTPTVEQGGLLWQVVAFERGS